MKPFLLLAGVLLLSISCRQSKPVFSVKVEEAAIRAVLAAEQIAWNNGNIEVFMEGYWKSDSLQFMSNRGVNHGWQETLDGYKAGYPDRAAMGTLSFEILSVKPINEIHFLVMGRFHLVRTSNNNLDGNFTLLFKKIDGKWVAVYDHTC